MWPLDPKVERLVQVKPYLFIYFNNNTVSEKKRS